MRIFFDFKPLLRCDVGHVKGPPSGRALLGLQIYNGKKKNPNRS